MSLNYSNYNYSNKLEGELAFSLRIYKFMRDSKFELQIEKLIYSFVHKTLLILCNVHSGSLNARNVR